MSVHPPSEDMSVATPWDPVRYLRACDTDEVNFSRGFMRCRPERWYPGFSAAWLPLAHSLGVEVQLIEIKPVLIAPASLEHAYGARVDGEPIGICFDAESARVIAESVAPGCDGDARALVLEYIARRFVSTAALSWSGAESSVVQFDAALDPLQHAQTGAVKLTVMVNSNYCTVWTVLSRALVDRLDGLWRRQIHAQVRSEPEAGIVQMEVAQLHVPPTMMLEYLRSGAVIDLEIPVSDQINLRLDGKLWMPARLGIGNGGFVIEGVSGPATQLQSPEGSTRISVELGNLKFDGRAIAEFSQQGAFYQSSITPSNRVSLIVQDEQIAQGTLCVFERRFAVVID